MDEKPILFNSKMVNAIVSGRKTQTRRVINPQPEGHHWEGLPGYRINHSVLETTNGLLCRVSHSITHNPREDGIQWFKCPYGHPGDHLWVRETWRRSTTDMPDGIVYRADNLLRFFDKSLGGIFAKSKSSKKNLPRDGKWRPSIFMPRWASRLYLRVENIRFERIQYIRAYECVEEGVNPSGHDPCDIAGSAHDKFKILWNSINEKRGFGWKENPFVWVVEFSCVEKPGNS